MQRQGTPKRYVVIDIDGHPRGFYSNDVHASVPREAVSITEEQYRRWHEGLCANPMRRYRLVNGQLVEHQG